MRRAAYSGPTERATAEMPIRISHFSDVLCIWAFISQVRVAELRANFRDEVEFDYRYFSVFGDVATKMSTQWADRGGRAGYAAHVQETAAKFEHVSIDPALWGSDAPASSMPAHLILCAARLVCADQGADGNRVLLGLDHEIRRSFFVDRVDVANMSALLEICNRQGLDTSAVEVTLHSGQAHAALSGDMKLALDSGVRASPTLIFNEGRQMLTGNVGYRVMEANVRELIRHPLDQHSWC